MLAGCASTNDLGRLNWGPRNVDELQATLAVPGKTQPGRALRRLLARAAEPQRDAIVVRRLQVEGKLEKDPRYVESQAAIRPLRDLAGTSLCARLAATPQREDCARRSDAGIKAWTTINHPTGNPINDSSLMTVLLALDLTLPRLTEDDRKTAEAWARTVIERGDAFFSKLNGRDDRPINNWQSWRVGLRAVAAKVLGDGGELEKTRQLIDRHVAVNIYEDGSTYDFVHRDALHYHIYDLRPLVDVALFAPDALSSEARAAILRGLRFLEPYVSGAKQHVEFARSRVKFDQERRQAGQADFALAPWRTEEARLLLRLARTVFPEIAAWTAKFVDENYSPFDKAVAALHEVDAK